MELDYMPQIVFGIIEEQPNFAIIMRQKNTNQIDDICVLQFAQ